MTMQDHDPITLEIIQNYLPAASDSFSTSDPVNCPSYHRHDLTVFMYWNQLDVGMGAREYTENLVGKRLTNMFDVPEIEQNRVEPIQTHQNTSRLRTRH